MNIIDIIAQKRDNLALTKAEIDYFIQEYTADRIYDYQAAALLMAIYLNGMNEDEAINLTYAMRDSGDKLDLSQIDGLTVDKHSSGGVGDKVSLILLPLIAAGDLKVAKMSGRGLGHTGGTIDKLEAIAGFSCDLANDDFVAQINKIGLALTGQTANLTPADKKLYALRDVTATVNSFPLIAASIMSKKLALGADILMLDIKYGNGAFMADAKQAEELASLMVGLGLKAGQKAAAILSSMEQPLGYNIGNALEISEAYRVLSNQQAGDLAELCCELAAEIFRLSGKADSREQGRVLANKLLTEGKAKAKFEQFIKAQGGDISNLPQAALVKDFCSKQSGYISQIAALDIGLAALALGAGRKHKEDTIDYAAGLVLKAKCGDYVEEGAVIAQLHYNQGADLALAEQYLAQAIIIAQDKPNLEPLWAKIVCAEDLGYGKW